MGHAQRLRFEVVKAVVPKTPTFIMPRKEFHIMRHDSPAQCRRAAVDRAPRKQSVNEPQGDRFVFLFCGR